MVHYRDNTRRDVNIDDITPETPRLWEARKEVLKVMDEYLLNFILNAFPIVFFIITINPIGVTPQAGGERSAAAHYVAQRRTIGKNTEQRSGLEKPAQSNRAGTLPEAIEPVGAPQGPLKNRSGSLDDAALALPFTQYQYQIDLIRLDVSAPVASFDAMYSSLAIYLAGRLSLALECRTIVVLNLQRILAAFESGIVQSVDENADEPGAVS